ncbi:LysR family transcriptional regulator [Caulobacter sp.]|uniref:LysR family transcriptional regulator n=1 Tax=Caulobacter sp. TaxID=78 RepID=UPI003BB18DAD
MDHRDTRLLNGLRITFSQVRGFVTVASTNSFTRAAEVLNLSQPALTGRIQQLEESLELRLFDRNTRSVELTDAGRELLPVFMQLVNDLEGAVINARDQAVRTGGTVRLACLPSCAATVLPGLIRAFRADRPDTTFVVEDALDTQVRARVREGEVDFGICARGDNDPDLDFEDLFQDNLQVVFRPGHPLAKVDQITVHELMSHPLILTNRASSVRMVVERAFAANGLGVTPACETSYMSTAVALVRAGLGVAILPSTALEARDAEVCARVIDDPGFARTLVLARRRGVPMRRIAVAFVDSIRQAHLGRSPFPIAS